MADILSRKAPLPALVPEKRAVNRVVSHALGADAVMLDYTCSHVGGVLLWMVRNLEGLPSAMNPAIGLISPELMVPLVP